LPYHPNGVTEIHIARAVCRRAERCLIKWRAPTLLLSSDAQENLFTECIIYLNRLSDYLFMYARQECRKMAAYAEMGQPVEETWIPYRESKYHDMCRRRNVTRMKEA
jgi:cob(I)alamin adenosyltransferase